MQQPFTVLLTQCEGQSVVTETIYTERFKHCAELNKMGANIDVHTPVHLSMEKQSYMVRK